MERQYLKTFNHKVHKVGAKNTKEEKYLKFFVTFVVMDFNF